MRHQNPLASYVATRPPQARGAFARNGYILLVADRPVDDLDEENELTANPWSPPSSSALSPAQRRLDEATFDLFDPNEHVSPPVAAVPGTPAGAGVSLTGAPPLEVSCAWA
ncbi:hypothetical protein [Nonomuraea dietziae]|uniref:hypothetical protein n=1 Tax=Nonomuraea dietziae TaxID=65515 RepID=UPI0033FAF4D0